MPHALISSGVCWMQKHADATPDHLGLIPAFLSVHDERPAAEQLEANYGYGPLYVAKGFTEAPNGDLLFPDDPPLPLLYETELRDEVVRMYAHAFVSIRKPDGELFITRMD